MNGKWETWDLYPHLLILSLILFSLSSHPPLSVPFFNNTYLFNSLSSIILGLGHTVNNKMDLVPGHFHRPSPWSLESNKEDGYKKYK